MVMFKIKNNNVLIPITIWNDLKSGNYRILYEIDDEMKSVKLLTIGHRKKIYKKK